MRDLPDGTVELKCRPEDEASMYAMGVANGLFARLGEVTVPVLVVCGEHQPAIPPCLGAHIVERLPNGRSKCGTRAWAFRSLEDPGRAVESMLAFTNA